MEDFFSLDWFKARIESATDKALNERIGAKVDKVLDQLLEGGGGEAPRGIGITPPSGGSDVPRGVVGKSPKDSPVMAAKLVNDTLTVVLWDGGVISKPNATEEDFKKIQACETKEEVMTVIADKVVAQEKKAMDEESKRLTAVLDGFNKLGKLKDFQIDGKSLLLKGTSRSIPQLLVDKFTEVVGKHGLDDIKQLEKALEKDDEYQGLKNFFMWCCLNPRAEVADRLYDFLNKNGMKITKQGFFVALRNVVVVPNKGGNPLLVPFISNTYNKVKAVWHNEPKDYEVVETHGDLMLIGITEQVPEGSTIIGNLETLYLNLPTMDENRYTDNWTHTFDIRIGQVVNMPKEKANWSTQDCATAGLHFAGHTAPYVLCGDTTVFTLHNPMKVVGIGTEKGRCWEYLPFMTTNIKEADQIMNSRDFDFLQLDEKYAIKELEDLAERAKEGFTTETSKYDFNLPSISSAEINSIVLSLSEMKKTISERISMVQ